jgi:hypothetical protein
MGAAHEAVPDDADVQFLAVHEETLSLSETEWIGPRVHLLLRKLYRELGREDEARTALATYPRQKRRGEIEERIEFDIGSILDQAY